MDFYIVLGVEREAAPVDIKRAYKRLARRYHPDINPGDRLAAQQFRQIAEAYETLIDPDRRRRYDSTGSAVTPAEAAPFGFEGFDFSVSVTGISAAAVTVLTILVSTDLTTGTGRFNLVRGAIGTLIAIAASISTSATGFLFEALGNWEGFLMLAAASAIATADSLA